MQLVEDNVAGSVRHVREHVQRVLAQRMDQARGVIVEYGESYTQAVIQALDAHKQGAPLAPCTLNHSV